MKILLFFATAFLCIFSKPLLAQYNEANVYWVGHSLISHKNYSDNNSRHMMELMETMAQASGKSYSFYPHIIPGAPIGWNWGVAGSWSQVEPMIQPLTDPGHSDYGSFDVIVVTEGVNIESSYDSWASSFYARKFFAAAKAANPATRLFLYESWHHYHAGDFQSYYGPAADYDWMQYMRDVRPVWEAILDEASDPSMTAQVPSYQYQGTGNDPGNSNDILGIKLIPTGQVFVSVLERLEENRVGDDWTYNDAATGNNTLSGLDFFTNPYLNFPSDLSTTVHGGDLDDIHPSDVLIYLNTLTHYAVIYGEDPADLPTTDYVPENIASIFKEVVWDVVVNDPRTGVTLASNKNKLTPASFDIHPNPATDIINIKMPEHLAEGTIEVYNHFGSKVVELTALSNRISVDLGSLPSGIYIVRYVNGQDIVTLEKIVKK